MSVTWRGLEIHSKFMLENKKIYKSRMHACPLLYMMSREHVLIGKRERSCSRAKGYHGATALLCAYRYHACMACMACSGGGDSTIYNCGGYWVYPSKHHISDIVEIFKRNPRHTRAF